MFRHALNPEGRPVEVLHDGLVRQLGMGRLDTVDNLLNQGEFTQITQTAARIEPSFDDPPSEPGAGLLALAAMREKTGLDLHDVARLNLGVSDMLVLSCPDRLSEAQAATVKERLKGLFPLNKTIVLDAGMSFQVVKPSSGDKRAGERRSIAQCVKLLRRASRVIQTVEKLDEVMIACVGDIERYLDDAPTVDSDDSQVMAFQDHVVRWMEATFSAEISQNTAERNHRFLEEALELVQAMGCASTEAHMLVDFVFNRPTGERDQEVGGVMVTLAALCAAAGTEVHRCATVELERCWREMDSIRAKQAGKPPSSAPFLGEEG